MRRPLTATTQPNARANKEVKAMAGPISPKQPFFLGLKSPASPFAGKIASSTILQLTLLPFVRRTLIRTMTSFSGLPTMALFSNLKPAGSGASSIDKVPSAHKD